MAAVAAIHAVVSGLAQHLTRAHQISPVQDVSCTFTPVGTSEFKKLDGKNTTCSIFVYRVSHNEHARNPRNGPGPGRPPLAVNMHLLLTMWADSPLKELTVLAWVMRELHAFPVLDRSLLAASGGFSAAESVQLIPEELTLDDMTKLWQALTPPLRPSITYVARNVQIGPDAEEQFAPAIATRYRLADQLEDA